MRPWVSNQIDRARLTGCGCIHLTKHLGVTMFLFFSNRLGCAGSLLLSLAVTAVLVLIFAR
jgi:hypothetical protein